MNYQTDLAERIKAYPQRFLRRNKNKMLSFLEQEMAALGHATTRTEGSNLLRCVNLETESDQADFIVMAHYDTPTILPPVLEPLVRLTGHTRQFFLFALIIALNLFFSIYEAVWWVPIVETIFWGSFFTLLIPNPKNYNDNTSGVLGVLYLAEKLSHHEGLRNRVKFVFLDNEENGLLGAAVMREKWQERGFPFYQVPIISLDCIGKGKVPVVVHNGKLPPWSDEFMEHFKQQLPAARFLNMSFLPINDNFVFRREGAVVVTMMEPSWIPGGYYIGNIHSPLDRYIDPGLIDRVVEGVSGFFQGRLGEEL